MINYDLNNLPMVPDRLYDIAIAADASVLSFFYLSEDQESDPDKHWFVISKLVPRIGEIVVGENGASAVVRQVSHVLNSKTGEGYMGLSTAIVLNPMPEKEELATTDAT